MKATGQYFHVVLFIMLYKAVLTSKFVDETIVCDHSYESNGAVLSCGTVNSGVRSSYGNPYLPLHLCKQIPVLTKQVSSEDTLQWKSHGHVVP